MSLSEKKARLLELLNEFSLKRGPVTLTSGKQSNYYFDARLCSLHSEGVYLIASVIWDMLGNEPIDAAGGLTLGADPIVGAVLALGFARGTPLNGFIVRKEEKQHGMKKTIEGPALSEKSRVLIIDDVVTSGASTVKAIEAAQTTGARVVRVFCVVDRLEGAAEKIARFNLRLEPVFTLRDFNL